MSTSLICDSVPLTEVELANCDCCGLTEECTPSYIEAIRASYGGKWICGLCAEAVKEEILRCEKLITSEEALLMHFTFCNKFRAAAPPKDPTVRMIRALTHVLRKRMDSPRSKNSQILRTV